MDPLQIQAELARMRAALDAAGIGTWHWDVASDDLHGNEQAYHLLGLRTGEPVSLSRFLELIHPADRARVAANLQRLRQGKLVREDEYRIVLPGGQVRWLLSRARATGHQHPLCLSGSIMDITERKQAELDCEHAARRLRLLLDNAPVGISEVDASGQYVYVNPRYSDITGYSVEELRQVRFFEITGEPFRAEERELARAILRGERSGYRLEKQYRRKDGSAVWVEITAAACADPVAGVQFALGIVQDVSQRKHAEEALRLSEERYRCLALKLGDIVFTASPAGEFREPHPAWERYTGQRGAVQLGVGWWQAIHADDRSRFAQDWDEAIDGGATLLTHARVWHEPTHQYRYCEFHAVPIYHDHDSLREWVGVVQDIQEQHAAEEGLRRSHAELERFAYAASHDLQEPLRTVSTFAELLVRRHGEQLPPEAHQLLQQILGGTERMRRLISDLLEYSYAVHHETPVTMAVDMQSRLEQVCETLCDAIGSARAEIVADPLPQITGDPVQIAQLLQNLIGNALKYRRPDVPCRITIQSRRDGSYWEFTVRDNGIGFDPKYADRIFGLFKRLHTQQEYPGTGVGLALCKRIVERHGGQIWAEGHPGEGAAFHFRLPA